VLWVMTFVCRVRIVTNLYVEVPGVVLIMRDMDPGVVGDDPLMQGEDCPNLYVEVPGVVLIMRDVDPGVVGDDPLMQGENSH
jgi:hypothetical protein